MRYVILILTSLFLISINPVLAHSGRTDSSGCHTCRTNCPKYGLSYGEYHCHGSRSRPKKAPKQPFLDRKSTRLNSSHIPLSRMPSSA